MEGCIPAIIPDVNHDANLVASATPFPVFALLVLLTPFSGGLGATPVPGADELLRNAEQALEDRRLLAAAEAFAAAADASPDVLVAERATQFTFGTGFDALAEKAAGRWAALAPENPLPHEVLGRLKLRRHAVDEAAGEFLAALGSGEPRRDEVYLAMASDLAAEDNAGLVTRVLSRLTALDPLAPGLQLALGTAALRSGDYALALGAGTAAAADDPDWPEPQLLRARALAATGREDEALAQVAAMSAAGPNPLIDLEYARLLADSGRIVEARERLAALVAHYGERPEISRTLAFLDLAAGDLDSADQRLAALDTTGPERFESFYYRGQIAAQRGDGEAARRFYGRISSGPYFVPAQLAMADTLARSDAGDQAVEEAVQQLARFGLDYPAQAFQVLEYRAHLLQVLKRPEEALAVYGEALQFKPAAVSVLLARGALLEEQGRLGEALDDLRAAVHLAPDDPVALNAFGYILANRAGQARKAWSYVRRAFEIQPDNAAIQDSVGWTLFKLGRSEEARGHLEEALDRLPDPEIASHLADVFWKLGDREGATDLLLSAAVAFPDNKPVRETAERLLD
jgi:tetratricopeptide (TPR) repeat protein